MCLTSGMSRGSSSASSDRENNVGRQVRWSNLSAGAEVPAREMKLLFEDGLLTDDFYDEKVAEYEAAR